MSIHSTTKCVFSYHHLTISNASKHGCQRSRLWLYLFLYHICFIISLPNGEFFFQIEIKGIYHLSTVLFRSIIKIIVICIFCSIHFYISSQPVGHTRVASVGDLAFQEAFLQRWKWETVSKSLFREYFGHMQFYDKCDIQY